MTYLQNTINCCLHYCLCKVYRHFSYYLVACGNVGFYPGIRGFGSFSYKAPYFKRKPFFYQKNSSMTNYVKFDYIYTNIIKQ